MWVDFTFSDYLIVWCSSPDFYEEFVVIVICFGNFGKRKKVVSM